MAKDAKTYLATEVISEQRTISYRNVSRALKVHVNTAKCMLFEFWERENKKKPGSIYATYLIAGFKKDIIPEQKTNGETHDQDDPMLPSSPPPFTSSMLEPSQEDKPDGQTEPAQVRTRTVTLVREEFLEEVKQQYSSISSLHIYSLSPARLPDLVALTDINRGLFTDVFLKEDPLQHYKTYGIIQNPYVRRRKGKRPVIHEATAVSKFQHVKEESKSTVQPPKTVEATAIPKPPQLKKEDSSRPSSRDSTSTKDSKKPTLRRDASDLFKAFAKQKEKPKAKAQSQAQGIDASAAEDVTMLDADEEGESEDEALFLDTGKRKPSTKKRMSEIQKEREDKAAKLRKMMDSEDDEPGAALPNVEDASGVKEAPPVAKMGGEQAETRGDEDDGVDWEDSDVERQRQKSGKAEASLNKDDEQAGQNEGPRKRRGKRKVMKKRTMRDEEGYLVTKEEAVWESFSEDESETKREKEKEKPKSSFGSNVGKSTTASQKSGKAGAAAGGGKKGGNIMSFFGKK